MIQRILSSYLSRLFFVLCMAGLAMSLGCLARIRRGRCLASMTVRHGVLVFGIFIAVSLISRSVLAWVSWHELSTGSELFSAFVRGLCYDACAGAFASLPWMFLISAMPERVISSKAGRILVNAGMFLSLTILLFIAISEYFFWDEFGARFNFIAVDYLVWTQEVWGNLSESYPLLPIFSGLVIAGAALTWWINRYHWIAWAAKGSHHGAERIAWPVASIGTGLLAASWLGHASWNDLPNQYNSELSKNGCWSFVAAFHQMELDYERWYVSLPADEAMPRVKKLLASPGMPLRSGDPADLHRITVGGKEEHRWNVMLICMESMSWDFMEKAGIFHGLTPHLDRLAGESACFENMYATGTRTVRGMEALTLCLPPTPGQSILYRPEGVGLATTFEPFLKRGYDCGFFYGGDGRFDYMNRYFSTAGCRVVDQGAWDPADTTFETSWGACDDDLFHKAIREADADFSKGKPFHYFCMTTSNHRPYDFPAGRIDMPSHTGRKAAVKYADQAIGDFIKEARSHPWFNDTLFVICADHCASSAGKTDIDVTKYRIPAMVYCPAHLAPSTILEISSQVDVMPTVLGMLGWKDETLGYGRDLLNHSSSDLPGRAFVSNYQKIGLLTADGLAILKPNRMSSAQQCDLRTGELKPLNEVKGAELIKDAAAYYQSASWLFKTGRLKRSQNHEESYPDTPFAGVN
jgi:hypothetical protein